MIDEATVRQVAVLAKLDLSDDEVARLCRELGAIAGYVAKLSEVTGGEHRGAYVDERTNVWRVDEVGVSTGQEQFLSNAPVHEAGYVKVPPIIE